MCKHYLSRDTCMVCRLDTPDIGTIAELNHEGDIKFSWDRKNPRECEAAHEHFDAMKKKGFLVFKVKKFGRKGDGADRFDPKEGKYLYSAPAELAKTFDPKSDYVVSPPVVGG